MSRSSEVMMWTQRVIARRGQPAHVILEVKEDVTPDQAQVAFHKIARTMHPDLHRHGLNAEEFELLNQAYAAVAGAYQELRTRTMQTARMKPLKPEDLHGGGADVAPPSGPPTRLTPPPPGVPANAPTPGASTAGTNPATAMSSKALTYYRKAELKLKSGDLKGAILQLKLACAADPASTFLRTALAEVETEVRKAP